MERMELACEEEIWPGALTDGGEASFIVDPPITLIPIVGENVAERTEVARLGRTPRNRPGARIFASRVAGGGACIFARVAVGAAIFGARKKRRRARVLYARLGGRAGIFACTQEGTARIHVLDARKVAARASLHGRNKECRACMSWMHAQ